MVAENRIFKVSASIILFIAATFGLFLMGIVVENELIEHGHYGDPLGNVVCFVVGLAVFVAVCDAFINPGT
jgi:hypothetical protein